MTTLTKEEIKEIERVYKKPISEIEETEIPAYIRKRELKANELQKDMFDYFLREWNEYYGAYQDEDGEWVI